DLFSIHSASVWEVDHNLPQCSSVPVHITGSSANDQVISVLIIPGVADAHNPVVPYRTQEVAHMEPWGGRVQGTCGVQCFVVEIDKLCKPVRCGDSQPFIEEIGDVRPNDIAIQLFVHTREMHESGHWSAGIVFPHVLRTELDEVVNQSGVLEHHLGSQTTGGEHLTHIVLHSQVRKFRVFGVEASYKVSKLFQRGSLTRPLVPSRLSQRRILSPYIRLSGGPNRCRITF